MRPRLITLSILTVLVAGIFPAEAALAQEVTRYSFRGSSAAAVWFDYDDNGYSETYINLSQPRGRGDPGRPGGTGDLSVFRFTEAFDDSTGRYSFEYLYGNASLERGQFHIDQQLESASADVNLTLERIRCVMGNSWEWNCSTTNHEGRVSVSWEGEGSLTTGMSRSRIFGDEFRWFFSSRSTSRYAVADGAITGDLNLSLGASSWAGLSRDAWTNMEWNPPA